VFTARYALSPYIKQIHFVFKGLKEIKPLLLYKHSQRLIVNGGRFGSFFNATRSSQCVTKRNFIAHMHSIGQQIYYCKIIFNLFLYWIDCKYRFHPWKSLSDVTSKFRTIANIFKCWLKNSNSNIIYGVLTQPFLVPTCLFGGGGGGREKTPTNVSYFSMMLPHNILRHKVKCF
jgi:hypothetical protein